MAEFTKQKHIYSLKFVGDLGSSILILCVYYGTLGKDFEGFELFNVLENSSFLGGGEFFVQCIRVASQNAGRASEAVTSKQLILAASFYVDVMTYDKPEIESPKAGSPFFKAPQTGATKFER